MPLSKKILLLIIAGIIAPSAILHASNLDAANDFLKSGEATKALQVYREALKRTEPMPAEFFYNLGTLALQANSPGESVVYLTKAAQLAPLTQDIAHNLGEAKSKVSPVVLQFHPASWFSWWPQTLRFLPWQFFLLLAFIFSAVLFWLATEKEIFSEPWHGLTLGLCLLSLSIALGNFWQGRVQIVGIISPTKLTSGPEESFPEIQSLDAGLLASGEEFRNGWIKVRFSGGEDNRTVVGWVKAAAAFEF